MKINTKNPAESCNPVILSKKILRFFFSHKGTKDTKVFIKRILLNPVKSCNPVKKILRFSYPCIAAPELALPTMSA